MIPRELVKQTLEFRNCGGRVPRQLWSLPCATERYPEETRAIGRDFPDDIVHVGAKLSSPTIVSGDMYGVGEYTDEWGCRFENLFYGVVGEVKRPLVTGEFWEDASAVHIPEELLGFDIGEVNAKCATTDRFTLAGCCPRPFEQLQFIRGTEALYMDLMDPPPGMLDFIEKMQDFYRRLMIKWARTDVDGLMFMDDWGSQKSLLINPRIWRELFRPLYQQYIDIAHSHGKKAFMHSDGYILDILPDLTEMGLDAINAQIFCIGIEKLSGFRGKLTFWGEIDRQDLLVNGTPEQLRAAVNLVFDTLWQDGGCIAQMEFGPGAKPRNVRTAFEEWNRMASHQC